MKLGPTTSLIGLLLLESGSCFRPRPAGPPGPANHPGTAADPANSGPVRPRRWRPYRGQWVHRHSKEVSAGSRGSSSAPAAEARKSSWNGQSVHSRRCARGHGGRGRHPGKNTRLRPQSERKIISASMKTASRRRSLIFSRSKRPSPRSCWSSSPPIAGGSFRTWRTQPTVSSQQLQPDDYVAVMTYDMHTNILTDFTQDKRVVANRPRPR